jgi:hypothetical protein
MSGVLALAAARADPVGDGPKTGEGQLKSKKDVKLSESSGEKIKSESGGRKFGAAKLGD